VTEMIENGEFDSLVPEGCKPLPPQAQFEKLKRENPCVVLIRGSINEPEDESSGVVIKELQKDGIDFLAVNVNSLPEGVVDQSLEIPFIFIRGVAVCGVRGIESL
jgi:hypothetical protein